MVELGIRIKDTDAGRHSGTKVDTKSTTIFDEDPTWIEMLEKFIASLKNYGYIINEDTEEALLSVNSTTAKKILDALKEPEETDE